MTWEQRHLPALAETPAEGLIDRDRLTSDEACAERHPDVARRHALSARAMSSFNNPAYRASIDETRRVVLGRDGHLDAARLCAACHDPVPLYSGRFDEPDYEPDTDPGASAGITCMTCHAMTRSGDVRGNADYRLGNPPAYPFEGSDHPWLAALHRLLIRAKPDLHKASLLNPGHRDPAFCGACHKVQLIEDLNHYRWLPGQNHHDSFLLSGVSGHRVDSFYYPQRAREGCADCHMPAAPGDDPAAHPDAIGRLVVADHLFPAGNTAIPVLPGRAGGNPEREDMLAESAGIDLFALRPAATEAAETAGILRPEMPVRDPGQVYDLDLVVRTTGIGHALTQGTADSNEFWLDIELREGGRIVGRSGGRDARGAVDPWSWFLNAYLLDPEGNRIERRNVQDIAVDLYDHQIPPGAAAVVHYRFALPADARGPLEIHAALRYLKLDTGFLQFMRADPLTLNDLPIATLAEDRVSVALRDGSEAPAQTSDIPAWQRRNE